MSDDMIKKVLLSAAENIENSDFSSAINDFQDYIHKNPDIVDDRLLAELGLINKMIEYKSMLDNWAYFRSLKLVYRYCELRYASSLPSSPVFSNPQKFQNPNIIWWCWLQGLENAPKLLQVCHSSLQKMNRPIIVITEDNYTDYVTLPDYIISKWKQGIISNTHFSDILRLELLCTYGGTWIDSTVFCSDTTSISSILATTPLFCYSFAMRDTINNEIMFDNWFLHCSNQSNILEDTRQMLLEYWQNEDTAKHYFIFHLLFSIACRRHPEECQEIPIFSLEPCHILQLEMMKPFSMVRWNQIMCMSGIHKLTYKYDKQLPVSNTFLEHILME